MQYRQTKILRTVFVQGHSETHRYGGKVLTMDYLLLAILKQEKGHAAYLLRKLLRTWELYQIRTRIENELKRHGQGDGMISSEDEESILQRLEKGVDAQAEPILNTAHLLMAIVREHNSVCAQALAQYDITSEKIEEFVRELPLNEDYYDDMLILDEMSADREAEHLFTSKPIEMPVSAPARLPAGFSPSSQPAAESHNRVLEQCATDLTRAAREGKFDPVVGREEEIERLIRILGRRKKNNPLLIGEAGVGKSAIVEGLAQRIVENKVSSSLSGKQLYSLDVASLVAGTKYRGEFEARIQSLLDELAKRPQVILFIDEIHTIVGAGSTQGSLDTANILKPVLARGEIQCIGATTLREYRESIENDGALDRRFQKIRVEPPSPEKTFEVLQHLKRRYETFHGIRYTDEALKMCVKLTQRYLPDRFFPDKAIDVMDEAGSLCQDQEQREPAEVRAIQRRIEQLSQDEKKAIASGNYEYASALHNSVTDLKRQLQSIQVEWDEMLSRSPLVVDEERIRQVVSCMTGIPLERMSQDEMERLKGLYEFFSSTVVGQDETVRKVTRALQRNRVGLNDPNRPIGVFMFVGPTGVGKTLLAKELALKMYDSAEALIRVDMSEFSEKHSSSRLIGSPPGYVGYGEGGQLTERVHQHPYSVVLFDEIEKAHPDIFNLMLQIFDEGYLTDSNGRKVDFRNTIIILTSNVGSREVQQQGGVVGYSSSSQSKVIREEKNREMLYRKALERAFAPEFINRVDDIVLFNTLGTDEIGRIVDLEIDRFALRIEQQGYRLEVSAEARAYLAHQGYEERYGVRSIKRTILDEIESPISEWIVEGKVTAGDVISVLCDEDGLHLERSPQLELVESIELPVLQRVMASVSAKMN